MNSDLNRLVENWKEVVDKPEVASAFMYRVELGQDPIEAITYKIDWAKSKEIVRIENLINIRITMGCNTDALTPIGVNPIFAPIISGIGSAGEKKHFEMNFDSDSSEGIRGRIPPGVAATYVEDWSENLNSSNVNKMDGVFIIPNGEILKYYTFDDEDTISIKDFSKERKDYSLFLHLGLEPSPTDDNPFKFRTVLEVRTEDPIPDNEKSIFYQLSSPCPPNCGRIIIR